MKDSEGVELPQPKPKIARSDGSRMAAWHDMVDRRLHVLENKRPKSGGYRYAIITIDHFDSGSYAVARAETVSSASPDGTAIGIYLDVSPPIFHPESLSIQATDSGIYLLTLTGESSSSDVVNTIQAPERNFVGSAPQVFGRSSCTVAVEVYMQAGQHCFFSSEGTQTWGRFTMDWRAPSHPLGVNE